MACDPADFAADQAEIGRIFLTGLHVATAFAALGWLLRVARAVDDALVELPDC